MSGKTMRGMLIGSALLAILTVGASPAMAAYEDELVTVRGSSDIYWVDGNGVGHFVPSLRIRRIYFQDEPVSEITRRELDRLPIGAGLSVRMPPSSFRTSRVLAEQAPGESRVIIGYGAPPVQTRVVNWHRTEVPGKPTIRIDRPGLHVELKGIQNGDDLEDALDELEDLEDARK